MPKWLRCCAFLVLCSGTTQAVDWKALRPQGYVSDFAGVVDGASRAQLERYCAEVERSTGAQIALVAIPTLHGEPIEDVANTLYRAWGVGQKGKDEGIMLLLVTGERRSRLEVGYGLEPYIPDGFAGSVLREMRPALRAGHFGEAFQAAAQTIATRVAEAKGVSLDAALERRPARQGDGEPLPWLLLLGGAALLVFLIGLGNRGQRGYHGGRFGGGRGFGGGFAGGVLPGLLLGHLMGRGMGRTTWGGRGSGGFGGFDSGDSFGGFGGGDSGGGGASSDW
jgi:uncharacterized protein